MSAPLSTRPRIYQLFVRLFGNTNETRKWNGSLAENGCGTFADINDAALRSLRDLGISHLWLTGIHEQASGTAYDCRPADDPRLLKGIAGSPYAIRDYFDVCPDYAKNPEKRLEEFRALLARCEAYGLKAIIDFVPNHVARSYASDVKPEHDFGRDDDTNVFFSRDNHFFYLPKDAPGDGPPLRLPTSDGDGCYSPESEIGRVTGNNAITWAPGLHDWYETVKLNYGHDFTRGRDTSHLPSADAAIDEVPRTWRTMDGILAYWQEMGVSGFRVDMAHMIPMEFWAWMVKRARQRDASVFFMAEAYDNDPAKLCNGHVLDELLAAGFDAVYDDPVYDALMGLYDEGKWCNDLDALLFTGERFHRSLRYGENHDEVRLAARHEWGGVGCKVGKPVCATLFAMGRGPVMIYNGQELGECAEGSEGFAGDNGRTTIFDYWSMPAMVPWSKGGCFDSTGLDSDAKSLREWYGRLLHAIQQPAFEKGDFYGLNYANRDNPQFGRIADETCSGHWLYAFLRHDNDSGQAVLALVNFYATQEMRSVRVHVPEDAWRWLGIQQADQFKYARDLLTENYFAAEVLGGEIVVPSLLACDALLLEILPAKI